MQGAGAGMRSYGTPSPAETVSRVAIGSQPGTTGSGASRTPLAALEGTITPSGLHFERHHSGVPAIDPAAHRLHIHGLVEKPLAFSLEALERYPLVTQLRFLECSGNGAANLAAPELPISMWPPFWPCLSKRMGRRTPFRAAGGGRAEARCRRGDRRGRGRCGHEPEPAPREGPRRRHCRALSKRGAAPPGRTATPCDSSCRTTKGICP